MNHLLLAHVAEDLMTVALGVLTTTYMDPVVATVGGFHDELVEIRVGLEP